MKHNIAITMLNIYLIYIMEILLYQQTLFDFKVSNTDFSGKLNY